MPSWKRLWPALALALVCCVVGSPDSRAEERGTRVAIIEMARILDGSSAIRSMRDQGEAQRRVYAADTQREAERLDAIRAELIRQESLLAPDALEERVRAFDAELVAADQRAQVRNRILQRALEKGENRFREALDAVVADVATRWGFEIVLPVHESLFTVVDYDLTGPVLERLNESIPEIALTFDES